MDNLNRNNSRWTYLPSQVVASLLIGAGCLKLLELRSVYSITFTPLEILTSQVTIIFEFILGFWLLSRVSFFFSRFTAIVVFTIFSTVNLYHIAGGDESCSCFGLIRIHPGYTLGLDILSIGLLIWPIYIPSKTTNTWKIPLLSLVTCIAFTIAIPSRSEIHFSAKEALVIGQTIHLDPQKWIGEFLPIGAYLSDKDNSWAIGRCRLIFYESDCSKCRKFINQMGADDSMRTIFVEINHIEVQIQQEKPDYWIHLDNRFHWLTKVPAIVVLQDGFVETYILP